MRGRFLPATLASLLLAAAVGAEPPAKPQLDAGFRRMYELRFDAARAEILGYEHAHPDDPLGSAAEAASFLFEEFSNHGVLTSEFFLNDDRLLGGIAGRPDPKRRTAFLDANMRARATAESRLKRNPEDADALFVLTMVEGMAGDFEALLEKRALASLGPIRRAERIAERLLALRPDALDAHVAIGAANYIIGSLPSYKRMFLWVGGIRGDRERGMEQLARSAAGGHYLRPLAKALLALVSKRERQPDRARLLFEELTREFPANKVFARELALLEAPKR
jgi:hypothetical protein